MTVPMSRPSSTAPGGWAANCRWNATSASRTLGSADTIWGVIRDVWGRGYASEGAAAAIDFAFDVLGWDEVIHCIDPRNAASQSVARKMGSQVLRQARLPAPFDDPPVDVWGQTREQWRVRRRTQH